MLGHRDRVHRVSHHFPWQAYCYDHPGLLGQGDHRDRVQHRDQGGHPARDKDCGQPRHPEHAALATFRTGSGDNNTIDKIDLSLISIIALQQNPNLENQLLLMQLSNLLPQQQQLATPALPPPEPLTTTFEVSF